MFDRRLFVLFFMLLIVAAAARPITDPDFWWHLRTGQYILDTRSIPHTDIFSSIRYGSEWVTHEWLSEVIMYGIFRLSGYAGLIAAFGLLIAATFYVTYKRAEGRAPHPYVAGFALMIGAAATIPTWGVRPQMFSMFFAALFLFVLNKYTTNNSSRLIWWLIPVMVLWVNLHAGFAAGLALIILTIGGIALDALLEKNSLREIWQRTRTLVLLLIAVAAAACINPHGVRMYTYPFETLRSSSMMLYIQEWRPPNFQDPMFLALLVLLVVLLCALGISKKPARPSDLFMLSVTLVSSMRSGRNVPFFALIAIPILADHLWAWVSQRSEAARLLSQHGRGSVSSRPAVVAFNILLFIIVPLSAVVLRFRTTIGLQPVIEARDFPTTAVQFIEANNVPQPIYNEYHWGGYLIWKLYPRYRVYIDGRADVYGDQVIEDFFKAHDGEMGWREPLEKNGVRTVLVDPNTALASLLREDNSWQKVFEDRQAVIFTRAQVLTATADSK